MTAPTRSQRILFLCPRYPYPPRQGDQVRAYHLIDAFARRAEVAALCFGDGPELPGAAGRAALRRVAPSASGRLRANLRRPQPALPGQVRLFLDAAMERAAKEEVERFQPDVVHVILARMGPYLAAAAGAHTHLDLTDSLSLNMASRAAGERWPLRLPLTLESRLLRGYEARLAAAADSASLVSELDRRAPGLGGVAVVPNGVDPQRFPFEAPRERPARALFFGNLSYFDNVGTATYLAEQVLPPLRRGCPGAELRLAGARAGGAVGRLARREGVSVAADVPAMSSELHAAAAALLPAFSGSGMRNKVLEAFCAGLPVVTNAFGMRGVEGAEPGVHYVLAETAAEMAAAVAALVEDPDRRLRVAAAARRLVEERYSWEIQADALEALYRGERRASRGGER